MDPLTILASVASLVGGAIKGVDTINKCYDKYSRAAVTIASMTAQCSCVEFALLQVQDLVILNPRVSCQLLSDSALMKHFMCIFGACQLVFSILNQRLEELVDDNIGPYGEMTRMGKIKLLWNDQEMKDLLRNIESQASALCLLLSALQMRTNAEMHDLLTRRESQKLFDKVSDDAASLRTAEDARMRDSIAEATEPSLHSSFDNVEFDFDFEIINTTTYRKAFRRVGMTKDAKLKRKSVPRNESFESFHKGSDRTKPESLPVEVQGSAQLSPIECTSAEESMHLPEKQIAEISLTRTSAETTAETIQAFDFGFTGGKECAQISQDQIDESSNLEMLAETEEFEITSATPQFKPVADVSDLLIDLSPEDEPYGCSKLDAEHGLLYNSYNELMEIHTELCSLESSRTGPDGASNFGISQGRENIQEQHDSSVTSPEADGVDGNNIISLFTTHQNGIGVESQMTNTKFAIGGSFDHTYALDEIVHDTKRSKVVIARKRGTKEKLAIKVVNRQDSQPKLKSTPSQLKRIHLEVAILHDLSHYNLVRIRELVELERQIVIVMEHASPCSLLQYIVKQRDGNGVWSFPEPTAWSIFRQLLSGIKYLHDNHTIHHNITLDNLLFDEQTERIVIKGFNIAEIVPAFTIPAQFTTLVPRSAIISEIEVPRTLIPSSKYINPYYTAPELLLSANKLDYQVFEEFSSVYAKGKIDVFSCGVVLFALLSGTLPFGGNMLITQFSWVHATEHYQNIMKTPLTKIFQIAYRGRNSAQNLILNLLNASPSIRYDINQAGTHEWLQICPENRPSKLNITAAKDEWGPGLVAEIKKAWLHKEENSFDN